MSKLLQRLKDASRSGVYRVARRDALDEALRGAHFHVAQIPLRGVRGKEALLDQIALRLGFPDWFGRNWDALEDCLTDLSWRGAGGHVLVFEGFEPAEELSVLVDVLASSAEFWAERGTPFFAVFVDPEGLLGLAALHRER